MAEPEGARAPMPPLAVRMPTGFDGMVRSVEATYQELRRTTATIQGIAEQNLIFNRRSLESIEKVESAVTRYQEASLEIVETIRRENAEERRRRRREEQDRAVPESKKEEERAPEVVTPPSASQAPAPAETEAPAQTETEVREEPATSEPSEAPPTTPFDRRRVEERGEPDEGPQTIWTPPPRGGRRPSAPAPQGFDPIAGEAARGVDFDKLRRREGVGDESQETAGENAMDVYARARQRPVATLREDLFRRASQKLSQIGNERDQTAIDNLISQGMDPQEVHEMMARGEGVPGGATRLLTTARNVAGGVSEGGFQGGVRALAGSLRIPAAVGLGAGAVIGGGHAALRFAENQRQQNLFYQQALGGTNFEGFGERAREFGFGLTQRGTMGSQEASQLFRGVTQMGFTDDRRQDALDEATTWFRRFGMSTQESVALIREASQNGVTAFGELTDALEGVSEVARETGQNAQQARQAFVQNLGQVQQITGGPNAPVLAQAMTEARLGMGRQLEGTQGDPFSEQQRRILASQSPEHTFSDITAMLATPEGAIEVTGMREDMMEREIETRLGEGGQEAIAEFIARHRRTDEDGNQEPIEETIARIPEGEWNRFTAQELTGAMDTDPALLMRIINQRFGENLQTETQATQFAARFVAGQGRTSEQLAEQQRAREGERISAEESGEWVAGLGFKVADTDREITDIGQHSRGDLSKAQERALKPYAQEVLGGGETDPILERFVTSSNFDDVKVQVQARNEDGEIETRVVTGEEAVQHYRDQITSGQAVIAEGDGEGREIGEHLGIGVRDDIIVSGDDIEDVAEEKHGFLGRKTRAIGESIEEFEERIAEESEGEGGGRVIIAPTDELRRLIYAIPQGNIEVEHSRYESVPPPGGSHPAMRP